MKFIIVLGVGLENRRTSGENEVISKNLRAYVRSRDRTYGLKYHNRRMASSLDIRSRV